MALHGRIRTPDVPRRLRYSYRSSRSAASRGFLAPVYSPPARLLPREHPRVAKVIAIANEYAATGIGILVDQMTGQTEPIWAVTNFLRSLGEQALPGETAR